MMGSVKVRRASIADVDELARLRWDFRDEERPGQSREQFLVQCAAWLEEALHSGRWDVAVAQSEAGRLVGCIYLQSVEKVPVPGSIRRFWGYVTSSYVEAAWRNRGIGGDLLRLLIEAGEERSLEFLIVWPSREAIPFYRRIGFEDVDEALEGPDDAPPMVLKL